MFHSSLCDGQCALRACIGGAPSIGGKSIFIVRTDGETVPVSISAAPLHDAEGKLIGGVESFRDLSEIHRLRREVERSHTYEDIVGKSPALEKIFAILPQVARSDATALIWATRARARSSSPAPCTTSRPGATSPSWP